jgi:hypothetical protein
MLQESLFSASREPAISIQPCVSQIRPPSPLANPYRAAGDKVNTFEIRSYIRNGHVSSSPKTEWYRKQTEYWFWDRMIEAGKSYMVGDNITMSKYLKSHSSPLCDWQKMAYQWAIENPDQILHVENGTHEWRVFLHGEYVEFELPYHEKGGERNYVTRSGKTKVLVNVD